MKKVIYYFLGVILFCGLPIISWGFNDFKNFISCNPRLIFITMMAIFTLLVVNIVPEQGRGKAKGKNPVKRQQRVNNLLQFISLFSVIALPYFDRQGMFVFGNGIFLRYLGLSLTASGYFFMNWSVYVLDKYFSLQVTIQENHKLITSGPYKYIRHPRYLGIILFIAGISLVFNSWLGVAVSTVTTLILVQRIQDEEKLLLDEFKNEWINYRESTKALIPFIY